MSETLPTLYKKTSTGALQEWTVYVEKDCYYTVFGQADGKHTESEKTYCTGKQGRSDYAQALFEAQALWTKKLRTNGYVQSKEDALAGGTDALVEGSVLPMLAHRFDEHGDKLVYPCAAQAKYDGHRCIGMRNGLWSRTRKPITGVPHILQAIQALNVDVVLDGELYVHSYRNRFEELTHFIRSQTPEPGHEIMEYHVYDCVMPGTFRERYAFLQKTIGNLPRNNPIKLAGTYWVNDEDELMVAFEDFLTEGFEGAVARQADGLYEHKRSYGLLKIKKFQDSEYKCIRVEDGVGKMSGHAVFCCVTDKGVEFKAKMKGDHEALKKYFENPKLVVGKQVTVKYQGLTNKNGVPRFPVALRIREDV